MHMFLGSYIKSFMTLVLYLLFIISDVIEDEYVTTITNGQLKTAPLVATSADVDALTVPLTKPYPPLSSMKREWGKARPGIKTGSSREPAPFPGSQSSGRPETTSSPPARLPASQPPGELTRGARGSHRHPAEYGAPVLNIGPSSTGGLLQVTSDFSSQAISLVEIVTGRQAVRSQVSGNGDPRRSAPPQTALPRATQATASTAPAHL